MNRIGGVMDSSVHASSAVDRVLESRLGLARLYLLLLR